jgi:hypothetical protein
MCTLPPGLQIFSKWAWETLEREKEKYKIGQTQRCEKKEDIRKWRRLTKKKKRVKETEINKETENMYKED